MNKLINIQLEKPELTGLVVHRGTELDRVNEARRYALFGAKMVGYATIRTLESAINVSAFVIDEMVEAANQPK